AEIIVAKHRSGRVDDVKMRFKSKYARFENWEETASMSSVTVGSRINTDGGADTTGGRFAGQFSGQFGGGSADITAATSDELAPF
ncbi:MAG: DnaB-like helicase C-terminal domain-containing protein, partial [Duncaniella sp.]|nr:DnaB-like helicase C-terminal domain-containing protein [Duncaniella sp.]